MKRNSITTIVFKVQQLSVRADRYTKNVSSYMRYIDRIRKAAVNEIIRLDSAPAPSYDLANDTPGADPVKQILETISTFPGYEFLKV